MDGMIFFSIFSMGMVLPVALGIVGLVAAVTVFGGMAYCSHLNKSIEDGMREFREEFGYEMGESPWS